MIIVGVDFSMGSAVAAAVAMRMAEAQGGQIRIIHVTGLRTFGPSPANDADAWFEGLGLGPEDVEVRKGVPWIELVRAVTQNGASILVAGTHGRSGFQPLRLGTTAELVSLRSPVPVMLVPATHAVARANAPYHSSLSQEEH